MWQLQHLMKVLVKKLKTEDFIKREKNDEVKKYKDMTKFNWWIWKQKQ